jgi:periplasmic divalent cation tolerance protein
VADAVALIYTTFPDASAARRVAQSLLDEGAIACANIFAPHAAVYLWQGAAREEAEVGALFKTTPERAEAAAQRLAALHPYDTPAILHWPARASAGFAAWVADATTDCGTARTVGR